MFLVLLLGGEDCPKGGGKMGLFKSQPRNENRVEEDLRDLLEVDGIRSEMSSDFLLLLLADHDFRELEVDPMDLDSSA